MQAIGEDVTPPLTGRESKYFPNPPFKSRKQVNGESGQAERIEYRELLVSEYVLQGYSNPEILRALHQMADDDANFEFLRVSEKTVALDRRFLVQRLQYQQLENLNALRSLWTARAEAALAALWPKIREGNMWAVDRMLQIGGFESRLWGLEQASGASLGDPQAQAAMERLVVTIRTMGLEPAEVLGQLIEGIRGEKAKLPDPVRSDVEVA